MIREMIAQFQNRQFGASADRIDLAKQPDLFNEAEAVVEQEEHVDEPTEVVLAAHKRGGRRKFPKSLPHVTIVHDIPEADVTTQHPPSFALWRRSCDAQILTYDPYATDSALLAPCQRTKSRGC